jgi:hypothetical protein
MKTIHKQDFRLSSGFIWIYRIGVLFLICMAVLSLVSPFFPDERGTRNENASYIISGILFLLFFSLSIWTLKTLRHLPLSNISVDTDGLWYSHLPKDKGLVPWDSISKIQEKATMQRLDLLDSNGEQLMRVEYQLSNFKHLRSLLSQMVLMKKQSISIPASFSTSKLTHYLNIGAMIGFSLLGWYVGSKENNPLLGYGGMSIVVGMILYEYLTQAWKIELLHDYLIVKYPLSLRKINYDQIQSVELADSFHKGIRHPEVVVSTASKRKLKLNGLQVDSTELYAIIRTLALH